MLILSVPYTGSHFLQKVFTDAGVDVEFKHFFCHGHLSETIRPVVSPIRDPWDCYVTWKSRNHFSEAFFYSWFEFNRQYEQGKIVHVQPVDDKGENREEKLEFLGKYFGLNLKTDWMPVSSGERKQVNTSMDLSYIYNLPVVKAQGYIRP